MCLRASDPAGHHGWGGRWMRCGRRPGFRGDPPISGPTGAGPVSVGVHSTGAVSPPTGCGPQPSPECRAVSAGRGTPAACSWRPGVVQGLTALAMISGMARTLELIQASSAADLLVPLVTALQQELGQETHAAKEVDEVAADVRRNLADLAASTQFLRDEVNLNQSRSDRLEAAVNAVNDYLKNNLTGYQKMERQGSYALGTLIKPVDDNDKYDADIQIVMNPTPSGKPRTTSSRSTGRWRAKRPTPTSSGSRPGALPSTTPETFTWTWSLG